MFIKNLLLKFKNSLFRFSSKKLEQNDEKIITPAFYWRILLMLFFVGIFVSCLANLYFFWYLNRVEVLDYKVEERYKLKENEIKNVLREFNVRKEEFLRLLSEDTEIVEP